MIKFPTGVRLMFVCGAYIYAGKVENAGHENIELSEAVLVYDTGPYNDKYWKESDYIGNINLVVSQIEAWGPSEKTVKQVKET